MKKTKIIFLSLFIILFSSSSICVALASNGYEKSISIEGTNDVEYDYKEDPEPKTYSNTTDNYKNRNITDIYPWNNNLYYPNYYPNSYSNYGYGIYYTGRPTVVTYSMTGMEVGSCCGRVPPPPPHHPSQKPPKHPPSHHFPDGGMIHHPH